MRSPLVKMILNMLLAIKMFKKIRRLNIFLQKMSAYRRDFDKTKYMSFLVKDEKLLEKYNEIWKNVSNIIPKVFDRNPVYNEKYIKTKIKSYNGKINTTFYNKTPKEGCEYICLTVIFVDLVYRKDKNYYPQVYLEECKYVTKEKGKSIKNFITYDIKISSDDSDKENPDEENSNEEN